MQMLTNKWYEIKKDKNASGTTAQIQVRVSLNFILGRFCESKMQPRSVCMEAKEACQSNVIQGQIQIQIDFYCLFMYTIYTLRLFK